jgi:hypothetical protein
LVRPSIKVELVDLVQRVVVEVRPRHSETELSVSVAKAQPVEPLGRVVVQVVQVVASATVEETESVM